MVRTIPDPAGAERRAVGRHVSRPTRPAGPKWQARLVVIVTLSVLLIASLAYAITRKQIQLTVDGQTRAVVSHRRLVRTLLASQHVVLGPADEVVPGLATPLKRQMKVVVYRAVPITVLADGRKVSMQTPKQTVGEVLAAAGIALDEDDRVEPSANTAVRAGMVVKVHRVEIKDVTRSLTIAFTVLRRNDPNLERGLEKMIQAGVNGVKEQVIRVTTEDGKVIKKVMISQKVIKQPVPKLVAVGTKKVVRTLRTSRGDYRYTERRTMVATAYDPSPRSIGPKATGYTYLGLKAQYGIVAVDPRVIPLRTRLYIPGYGVALAADTGGAIKGNRIDLCFNTYEEAIRYGRRKVEVYVLE